MKLSKATLSLILCTVFLLTACGTNSKTKDKEPNRLAAIEPTAGLKTLWRTSIADGQGKIFNRLEPYWHEDTIYVAAQDGTVAALDKESSDVNWQIKLPQSLSGGVAYGNDKLLLGALSGELLALSATDGAVLWQAQLSSELAGKALEDSGLIVARSIDGRVYGFDAQSGNRLWIYEPTMPLLTLRGYGEPVFYKRLVIIGLENGKLVALDRKTGALRWENRVAIGQGRSEIERLVDIDASPFVLNDIVIAASYHGRIMAYEADSGRPLWQADAATYNDMSSGFGNIYISTKDANVVAISRHDGRFRWEQTALKGRKLGAPLALSSYVLVADYQGYVHILSQVDGSIVGRRRVDIRGVRANIQAQDDEVLIYGNAGVLALYQTSTEFLGYYTTGGIPARSEVMRKRLMHPEWQN